MSPVEALIYSFLFGLLHGILPDEHTWPITFSYAIGGASGKEGIKAGLYFSSAFTVQRMLISELSYLAMAPFLMSASVNGFVYFVVGVAMSAAGAIVLRKNRYPHIHVGVHWHEMPSTEHRMTKANLDASIIASAPPARWTVVHGFIAGFGFGGFSLFVNTVAAPAMPSPWLGFLPGLMFGLGTMIVLVLMGGLFGTFLQHTKFLTAEEIRRLGAQTGGRTLFFGGLLFGAAGVSTFLGLDRYLPIEKGNLLIGLFMIGVAIPAFVYSLREIREIRRQARA